MKLLLSSGAEVKARAKDPISRVVRLTKMMTNMQGP
jgi:hypothetical protein